ncbi:unnamed protein product (macronuclear) [Paramecium tetraurelia]|uniref:ribose-phosphate diphosphokinase n=1 Tax=Paramecium tetraurelia TaxID=5888 RepID=A0CY99_PARTE|nr:uncharacterized protein GSPATT00011366001 [Paramecium tetraurelia]CAK75766.1 unnamed protein product [Paramecium tetraurelia]|eukprot:XP_001443163.1 hypothetical protein (macronuclear) [Paramecium tetraurelia strain d4-2]
MFTKLFSTFRHQNIFRNYGKQFMLVGLLSTICYRQKLSLQVNPNIKQYGDNLNRAFKRALVPEDDFYKNTIILSGNSNKELAEEIAEYLNIKLGSVTIGRFADGECQIQVLDNIRGKDVFIIQSTSPPVNDNLMELLLLVSALRRASARKIIVVVPYYGYARQDRKCAPRVPISAADVARLLETVGVDRLISVDLHCGQIQGFFGPRVPVDNLEANLVAQNYLSLQKKYEFKDVAIVSPDAGGVYRAKKFQEQFDQHHPGMQSHLAMIIKQREGPGKIASMNLVGQVKGKDCIIVDDIIDTAGTLSEAARVLKEQGAKRVFAFATHALFSGKAFAHLGAPFLDQIIVTNTIPSKPQEEVLGDKICRLSVAPLLAEAIYRVQKKESVSTLFDIKH